MFKKIYLVALLSVVTNFSFANSCGMALPTDNPNFCASFKAVAQCICLNSSPFPAVCADMNTIYSIMKEMYGSMEGACMSQTSQEYTTPADCMNNWNCYLHGGVDSSGRICSSNYSKCP